MKTTTLIAVLLLTFINSKAQNTGPNELHCTEQTITFKTGIRSLWHFAAPVNAHPRFTNPNPSGSESVNKTDYLLPSALWPLAVRNTQNPGRTFPLRSSPIYFKYPFPAQESKFSYNFYPVNYHFIYEPKQSLFGSPAF